MQILRNTHWEIFEKATESKREKIIEKVKESGLRGRGGANFPTGLKWELMGKGERYLIVNADEGEPGTFKDKFIIEHNLPLLIEGIAIASYAMDIHRAYFYLRGEYAYLKNKIEKELKKSEKHFRKIKLKVSVIVGAGSYLCGEETSILESIEGRRPVPRLKPPYPSQEGLYGKPTCVDNVETLANIPLIISGNWNPNLELFSLSGDLEKPGVYEIEIGKKLGDIISLGKPIGKPKLICFGASGGCIPFKKFESMPVNYKSVSEAGAFLGGRGLIVAGEKSNLVKFSKIITEFFIHESCGFCTPCREGNYMIWKLLDKIDNKTSTPKDIALLEKLATNIKDTSYCGLGMSSTNHILCELKYFRGEFK